MIAKPGKYSKTIPKKILSVKEKLTIARAGLVLSSPFYASIALQLELVEDKSHPTAYTDSIVLGYNPDYIKTLKNVNLKALICHEVLHIAMLHPFREGPRKHEKWNRACDYAINPIVREAGYTVSSDWLFNDKYKDLEAEVIYNMLPDEPSKYSFMGEVKKYKQNKEDKANPSYAMPSRQQRKSCKRKIARAASIAKMQGNLPAYLRRLVDDILEAKISWKEILAQFVTENSRNDYSWTQPNKRYLYSGMYLPRLNTPTLGTIVVIIDTSGSICQAELNAFAGELTAVLSAYPGTIIKVIYVDAAVANVDEMDVYDFNLNAKGGGGTDFIPGFEYIEKESLCPSFIIYFTDGYCDSFPEEPDFPVLWALTGKAGFNPPFGNVIYIDKEEK